MNRIWQAFRARVGRFDVIILALLGVALFNTAWTLSQIVRGLDFELVATMAFTGAFTGWILARSRLRAGIAIGFALVVGIATTFVRVGQLGGTLFALVAACAQLVYSLPSARVNAQPLGEAFTQFSTDAHTLLTRATEWLAALAHGQPKTDLVAAALAWSFGIWLAAAWTAWMLRRREQTLVAFAPLLLGLGFIVAYSGFNALAIVPPVAVLLILLVVVPHRARYRQWERAHIPAAQDLGVDLAFSTVPAILAIVVLAALVPAFSPQQIARWVQEWSAGAPNRSTALSDAIGIVPAPRPITVFDSAASPGLPRSHLLGASPELLKTRVLTIQTDEAKPTGYYWLGSTYDLYTGHGWVTSALQLREYRAHETVYTDSSPAGRALHQTIRAENRGGLVYAAGVFVSVDRAYQIAWRMNQDLFAARVDANEYRVESRIRAVNEQELRAATDDYPGWIRAQYLLLPDTVPPRVLALARDLTATQATPYDRARAIENYLRTIPYTLDVPAPPGDRDVADYFLFDLKRGYCDYYATAMTVLARAAGVPARVAVGYAAGTFDDATQSFVVTEADAHSWTQIYFPEYGWVDFEPTSARSVFDYDASSQEDEASPPGPRQGNVSAEMAATNRIVSPGAGIVPIVLAVLIFCILLCVMLDVIRLRRMPAEKALTHLYRGVVRHARYVGLPVNAGCTPSQVASLIEKYFTSPARWRRLKPAWQFTAGTVRQIVEVYVETTYGAHRAESQKSARLIQHWQRARLFFWIAILLHICEQQVQRILSRGALATRAADNGGCQIIRG